MPLKRMLNDSRAFEPKAVALLLETFDEIVADLDLRIDADREKAAKIVMRLGTLTAAATLTVAPVLVITLLLRRRVVEGLTFGAVK